jgi:hypothetical protein
MQLLGPGLITQGGNRPALLRAAVGAGGQAVVVWQQLAGKTQRVVAAQAKKNARFGRVRAISPRGVSAFVPDVAVDGSGRAAVVWVTQTQVKRALLRADGSVSQTRTVAAGPVPDEPTVSSNSRGDLLYGWIQNTNTGAIAGWVGRERANGAVTRPQRLQHVSTTQIPLVDVAVAPNGRGTVVWEQDTGNSGFVWAASAAPGGRFGFGQRLSPAGRVAILGGGGAGSRGIGVDNSGRASAIWLEDPTALGPGTSRVRVATSNTSGRFTGVRTLQSVTGTTTLERSGIGVGPGGALFAAWAHISTGASAASSVWGAAASAPRRAFSRPKRLSGPSGDHTAVAATSAAGAGVAVWTQGQTAARVVGSYWSP